MNCDEMKRLFNSGCYSYEKIKGGRFIINHTANELHIFNCIMLSNEINKCCNSINNKPNIEQSNEIKSTNNILYDYLIKIGCIKNSEK